MNLEMLKESNRIIFECISGSNAYGTNTPASDIDIRGIFIPTKDEIISIKPMIEQVSDKKSDITYYGLKRFFELASENNPNIVELFNIPEDCVQIRHPIMQKILDNRHLFISKKSKHSFSGYAFAQIKKAKGQNKFVNNPLPKEHPTRIESCIFRTEKLNPPLRSIVFGDKDFPNLDELSIARVEDSKDTYRLYKMPNSKGVFDAMGNMLFEKISIEDEEKYYIGMLQYSKESYDSRVRQWENYWDWKNNRNEARWHDYDKKEFECDFKNMSHCVRLILSCKNILLKGLPIVRLEGDDLKLVRDVRSGKIPYDEIIGFVEDEEKKLDDYYKISTLQHSVDMDKIDQLYKDIINEYILV